MKRKRSWTDLLSSLWTGDSGRQTTNSATNRPRRNYNVLVRTSGLCVNEQLRSIINRDIGNIDLGKPVEEERLPGYCAEHFYPANIGEVLHERYKIVSKLGYGRESTTWLARDFRGDQMVALKICTNTSSIHEVVVYDHIVDRIKRSTNGVWHGVRRLIAAFQHGGPHGKHIVLVFEAAQMSFRDMQYVFSPKGLQEDFVKVVITSLLNTLDFLHTQAEVVHADVSPSNLLLSPSENSFLLDYEELEKAIPTACKILPDRNIYLSRVAGFHPGLVWLSDFGDARIGPGPHTGDVQPIQYRAPEVLLHSEWSYPVDIWNVGLTAWDLLGERELFTALNDDEEIDDSAHFAELVGVLGLPPAEFLARNPQRAAEFWDWRGKWKGHFPIPIYKKLESMEDRVTDSRAFIKFMRRTLTWLPEERATAKELLQDPWLLGN